MNRKLIKKDTRGVTMMETIIALGVLVFGVVTAMALMASTLAFSHTSEQSIIVSNLAREGIEIVRSTRDFCRASLCETVLSTGDNFFSGSVDNCYLVDSSDDNYNLKTATQDPIDCQDVINCDDCQLYLNTSDNRYNHTSGDTTIFKRAIRIESKSSYEKKVTSIVTWSERGRNHEFILEDYLTDW